MAIQDENTATTVVRLLRSWSPVEDGKLPVDVCLMILRRLINCEVLDTVLSPLLVLFHSDALEFCETLPNVDLARRDVHKYVANLEKIGLLDESVFAHQEGDYDIARAAEEAASEHLNSRMYPRGCLDPTLETPIPIFVAQGWGTRLESLSL